MYERFSDLSSRARRCIRLAIRDERLTTPEQISELSDTEVMWRVRGNGQVHGIGKKDTCRSKRRISKESKG